ncbi:MAG: SpoIIIAH-like family protein [Firmicutes bacterium]|nr:SpoIIIAH-like family protein [Bacillota bacterium]
MSISSLHTIYYLVDGQFPFFYHNFFNNFFEFPITPRNILKKNLYNLTDIGGHKMINKQNLWFITLFSLILILGIYYVSMPKDALTVFSGNVEDSSTTIEVSESDVIVALKVEEEEKILAQMEDAQKVLLDETTSVNEKNEAYETLQLLNSKKGKVMEIEQMLKDKYNLDSCVKIEDNKINVILSCENQGTEYANTIIKSIQDLYQTQMYITIKFQS